MSVSINNVLTKEECQQLIQFSEKAGFHPAQVNTLGGKKTNKKRRNNHSMQFNNAQLANQIWKIIEPFIRPAKSPAYTIPTYTGFFPTGISSRFKIYRYHPGEKFSWHQDGIVSKGFYELSKLTLLVYLNDRFQGGCTEFNPLGHRNKESTARKKIKPITGSALIFPHVVIHQGGLLESGVKYVLRNDVFYKRGGIFGR